MANIRFGPLVSEVRGSIGGTTFLRTGAGPAARQRIKPVVTVSATQGVAKVTLSALVQRWSLSLDEAQRDGWRSLASTTQLINSLGEPYTPTGLQLYVRTNGFLYHCNEVAADDAPSQAVIDIPSFTWGYTAGTGFVVSAIGESPVTAGFVSLRRTAPWPIGRHSMKGPMVESQIKAVVDFAAPPVTIWAAADLVPLKSYFFLSRLYDSTTGGLSAPLILRGQTPAIL